jgi:hypothetical protein
MVAIFVTMAFCTNIALTDDDRQHAKDSDKKQNNDTIQQDTTKKIIIDNFIAHKDSTIKHLFYEIDSIAYNKEKNTSDSINNNKDIVARNTINKQLDSLRYDNKIQLKRAQRAAEQSPSYISDIPCNEETFYTFFHVPEVKRAHRTYDKNQRTIEKLRAARRKLPQSTTITRNITQYFDSLSNAQIMNRLLMIERLLQQKDSTISEKRR